MRTALLALLLAAAARAEEPYCAPGPSYDKERCETAAMKRALKCKAGEVGCLLDEKKRPSKDEERRAKQEAGDVDGGESLNDDSPAPSAPDDNPPGRPKTQPAEGTTAPPPAQNVDRRRSAAAVNRAGKLGDAMIKSLRSVEDLPSGAPGAATGSPSGAPPSALAIAPPPDFANPQTKQDLILASVSGFSGSFAALGLKAGRGATGAPEIFRRDGTAASQAELDRLSAHIASEPLALMQRPDFFQVLPREGFGALKREFGARAANDAFKDIELSGGARDFLHSQSCSRLSGDCNRHARKLSYKRGDYVPPEDLSDIWEQIKKEGDDPNSAYNKAAAEGPDPSRAPRTTLGLVDKMKNLLGGFGGVFTFGEPQKAPPSSPAGPAAAPAGAYAAYAPGARETPAGAPARKAAPEAALPAHLPQERAAPAPDQRRFGWFWLALSAAAGLALLVSFLKRGGEDAPPP